MFWPPSGGWAGLFVVMPRSLVTPRHSVWAGPAGGPRDAVRMRGRHCGSPFPVRLDVRDLLPVRLDVRGLQPRGDQDLSGGPGEDADDSGQAEELAVERGGTGEPGHEEQERHDLDEIG